MRRADRLFEIVQLLRGGRLRTAQELADKLEVNVRTIYRDIDALVAAGVPIDGAAGVGYLLRPDYTVPPLMFTPEEVLALVGGARMAQAFGGADMSQAAQEALVKLICALPGPLREMAKNSPIHAMNFGAFGPQERVYLDQITKAILHHTRLEMHYQSLAGDFTKRTVRPLGQWYWGKVWTVVTWCELRQDFRTFRVDRILGLTEQGPFKPQQGQTLNDFRRYAEQCDIDIRGLM